MKVLDLARAFLSIDSMTPKKLQKLCYYAQGWYSALTCEKLFDEEIQAWVHGPVCPPLYEYYKGYGYNDIPKEENVYINEEIDEFTKQIYRIYGNLDGDELEQLTHKESPWINARNGKNPWEPSNEVIKFSDIQQYFSNKLKEIPDNV